MGVRNLLLQYPQLHLWLSAHRWLRCASRDFRSRRCGANRSTAATRRSAPVSPVAESHLDRRPLCVAQWRARVDAGNSKALPPGPDYMWEPTRWVNEGGTGMSVSRGTGCMRPRSAADGRVRSKPPARSERRLMADRSATRANRRSGPRHAVRRRGLDSRLLGLAWWPSHVDRWPLVGAAPGLPNWEAHRWVNEGGRWRMHEGGWRR